MTQSGSILEFYEAEGRRAERYAAAGFWERRYHVKRQEVLRGFLHEVLRTSRSFLDVGCGTGEYLVFASQRSPMVVGVDLSTGYLARTKSKGIGNLVRGDTRALPFRDQVIDCILISEVLEHLSEQEAAISELFRVSRRWILVSMPNEGLLRRIGKRISKAWVSRVDVSVGHVGILSVEELRRKLSRQGWVPRQIIVLHVFPPTLDEMGVPQILGRLAARLEKILDHWIPELGTTSIVLLERGEDQPVPRPESQCASKVEASLNS